MSQLSLFGPAPEDPDDDHPGSGTSSGSRQRSRRGTPVGLAEVDPALAEIAERLPGRLYLGMANPMALQVGNASLARSVRSTPTAPPPGLPASTTLRASAIKVALV